MVSDKCAKVRSDFKKYKSDGKTFENVKLVFIQGRGSSNLFINFKKEFLLTKGIYTEGVSYTFSGRSLQNKLTVNIFEVNRDDKGIETMSGQFTFEGTFERNFKSFNVTKTGSFNNVNF